MKQNKKSNIYVFTHLFLPKKCRLKKIYPPPAEINYKWNHECDGRAGPLFCFLMFYWKKSRTKQKKKEKTLLKHKNNTGCAKKKVTKVVGYNFACVWIFLMKFGYVIGIGCKFFHKKFQGSSLKNVRIIRKKLFLQCLRYLYAYKSAWEYQKGIKIWWNVAQ